MGSEGMEGNPSWISKVIIAIEKVRDHLHHGFKQAHFITWLAAKDTKLLSLHHSRPFLLKLESVLPGKVCLVPVIRGHICVSR